MWQSWKAVVLKPKQKSTKMSGGLEVLKAQVSQIYRIFYVEYVERSFDVTFLVFFG